MDQRYMFGTVVLFGIAFLLVYNYCIVEAHENVHDQIFKQHGCLETKIEVHLFSGHTECVKWDKGTTTQMDLQARELTSLNEMFTYPIRTLTNIVILGFTLLAILVVANGRPYVESQLRTKVRA